MTHYMITPRGLQFLEKAIQKAQAQLTEITKNKSDAGAGQDGWHDEGFQRGIAEEQMWSKKVGDLQKVRNSAHIITPEEQAETVKIGVGVILQYESDEEEKFLVEGYLVNSGESDLSLYSPLGKAIFGAREGEKRTFSGKQLVTIKKIVPPSETATWVS